MDMDDLISTMPNEILFHIISSLPFDSSKQTILLSKRFKSLWETSLVQHGTYEDSSTAISKFLTNFNEQDPSKNTRKLQFHFTSGSFLLAIIAPNQNLILDFSNKTQENREQFTLKLGFISSQPSSSFTLLIKKLHLMSVSYLTTEVVSCITSNFRFLEILKITNCNGLQSLSIESESKLLSLTIFDCLELEFLHIRSYKLRIFRFRGFLPSLWPEYHYNLVDAFLDFRRGPRMIDRDFDSVLLTIKNVKVLTLCKWTFEALICPLLATFVAEFQLYNVKELWWIESSYEKYDCDFLISFLKLCPSLEQLFVTIDPKCYYMKKTTKYSLEAGKNTKLKHLKMVKLDGFAKEADEIYLAQCLEQIITCEPVIFLSAHRSNCTTRLSHSDVHRPQEKSIEAKVVNQVCPKHLHMGL